MTERAKILVTIGTRPEVVKLAPVITAFRAQPNVDVVVLATAQHRALLDSMLEFFAIEADRDLDMMRAEQSLTDLTSRMLPSVGQAIEAERPDFVIAQGDTTTVFVTALASRYCAVPFAHVEAGLRTGDMLAPFPEELNRRLVGDLATLHFAPTQRARQNLVREGVCEDRIEVTGNTVVDAMLSALPRVGDCPQAPATGRRLILVTAHRRENFGEPMEGICEALTQLAARADLEILFPVHPNPGVRDLVYDRLSGITRVHLCEPLGYAEFLAAMRASHLILTDSGGVQEEAPSLAVPVLVLRNATERPEAVEAGAARIVGTDPSAIVSAVDQLLSDASAYAAMASVKNPFGDGRAALRIVESVLRQIRSV